MIKKVTVNHECIACGLCEEKSKEGFRIKSYMKSEFICKDIKGEYEPNIIKAFKACPVQAIEIVSDDPTLQTLWRSGKIIEKKMLTETVMEIKIDSDPLDFKAGQYVTIRYSDFEGSFNRAYSVVGVEDRVSTFCITIVPDGRGSKFLVDCAVSSDISLTEARGEFFLIENENPKIFIATGTGIAPIIPMMEMAPEQKKVLYFGVCKEKDIFYSDRLKEIPNLDVKVCLDFADDDWTGHRGRVTEFFSKDKRAKNSEVYTCGSEPMMLCVEKILTDAKHDMPLFHRESFAAALPRASEHNPLWRMIVRNVHFYSSLLLCVLFLFFGFSGFMANRPELFNSEEGQVIPKNIVLKKDELSGFLKTRLTPEAKLERFESGEDYLTLIFKDGEKIFTADIMVEDRSFTIIESRKLPEGLETKTLKEMADTFSKIYPGELDEENLPEEGEAIDMDEEVEIYLESVWRTVNIIVDRTEKSYTVEETRENWVKSITNLHRGKHAGKWQKYIIDLCGLIMVLVTLTGIIYALLSRVTLIRVITILLVITSIILTAVMLINR